MTETIVRSVSLCALLALSAIAGCGSESETAVVGTQDERAAAQQEVMDREKEMEKEMMQAQP